MKLRTIVCSIALSLSACLTSFAHGTNHSGVELLSGSTGQTYTWTTPLGTQITMPVINKDDRIKITDGNGGSDFFQAAYWDPSGQLPSNTGVGHSYKNSAFAVSTSKLSVSREYTPVTFSNHNSGEPILSKANYNDWNGQDVIIALYTYYGDHPVGENGVTIYGDIFKENFAGNVEFFYVSFGNNSAAQPAQASWKQDSRGWWFQRADGSYIANDWLQENGIWYYFNAEGYMSSGWEQVKGDWYYFNTSGAMLHDTQSPDGYRLGSDGRYLP